jgi:hypothetical protein
MHCMPMVGSLSYCTYAAAMRMDAQRKWLVPVASIMHDGWSIFNNNHGSCSNS